MAVGTAGLNCQLSIAVRTARPQPGTSRSQWALPDLNCQRAIAVGLAVGLTVGLIVGPAVGLAVGLAVRLAVHLAVRLAMGLAMGLAGPKLPTRNHNGSRRTSTGEVPIAVGLARPQPVVLARLQRLDRMSTRMPKRMPNKNAT